MEVGTVHYDALLRNASCEINEDKAKNDLVEREKKRYNSRDAKLSLSFTTYARWGKNPHFIQKFTY